MRNRMIQSDQKSEHSMRAQNIMDAWTSLGGSQDKTGHISKEKMETLVVTLGLNFDVEQQLDALDTDNDGKVDFQEFRALFNEE